MGREFSGARRRKGPFDECPTERQDRRFEIQVLIWWAMVWMWLVGGPNGSGKSTLASTEIISQLPGSPLIRFNPDDLSKKLRNENTTLAQVEINIRAVRTIDAQVAKTIEERKSFLTETVLSTDKYKHMVNRAKELDFSIGLLFVTLRAPEYNIERVRLRAERGGHDVPIDKIKSRWDKSLANLAWFVEQADIAFVYDNSEVGDRGAELIASKERDVGLRLLKPGANPRVDAELRSLLGTSR